MWSLNSCREKNHVLVSENMSVFKFSCSFHTQDLNFALKINSALLLEIWQSTNLLTKVGISSALPDQ